MICKLKVILYTATVQSRLLEREREMITFCNLRLQSPLFILCLFIWLAWLGFLSVGLSRISVVNQGFYRGSSVCRDQRLVCLLFVVLALTFLLLCQSTHSPPVQHTNIIMYVHTYIYLFQLSDRYKINMNRSNSTIFLGILYFLSFYHLFSVVGEFYHCGPYSLLIIRLTIGPTKVTVLF